MLHCRRHHIHTARKCYGPSTLSLISENQDIDEISPPLSQLHIQFYELKYPQLDQIYLVICCFWGIKVYESYRYWRKSIPDLWNITWIYVNPSLSIDILQYHYWDLDHQASISVKNNAIIYFSVCFYIYSVCRSLAHELSVAWWRYRASWISLNIGLNNGLLPGGAKPVCALMLACKLAPLKK